jgi:hypothetical protein
VLWGFPRSRTIALGASLANSVVIRCQNDQSYRPSNLRFTDGAPAPEYSIVPVVVPALAAQAAGGGMAN